MKEPLISVIVPVFNSSPYLDRCIESILNQDYYNLELFLIDDGSTDNSLRICKKWAKQDNRIFVVSTENHGQGQARNLGVSLCHGDYVFFVDSDDWIEKDTLSSLSCYFLEKQYDIICFANDMSNSKGTSLVTEYNQPNIMLEHLLDHPGIGQSPCDKIFKKNIVMECPFPNIRGFEDTAVIYKMLSISSSLVYVDRVFYHYTQHDNSTMHHAFCSTNFMAVSVYNDMFLFYSKEYPQYAKYAKRMLVGTIMFCVGEYCCLSKKEELSEYFDKTMQIARRISYSSLNLKSRFCLFLIKHNLKLYAKLYRRKHK